MVQRARKYRLQNNKIHRSRMIFSLAWLNDWGKMTGKKKRQNVGTKRHVGRSLLLK
jgi:hypothetical protein